MVMAQHECGICEGKITGSFELRGLTICQFCYSRYQPPFDDSRAASRNQMRCVECNTYHPGDTSVRIGDGYYCPDCQIIKLGRLVDHYRKKLNETVELLRNRGVNDEKPI